MWKKSGAPGRAISDFAHFEGVRVVKSKNGKTKI